MALILITGGAGKTGRAIIRQLLSQGAAVRVLIRRPEQADILEEFGPVQTMAGDMRDPAIMDRAAAGVQAIYHICPNMHPEEVTIGENVIRAAGEAGVARFVYHSVLHPQTEAMPHHWMKLRVEERLLASGLAFTILQPAAYMQNIVAGWARITGEGVYAVPYALETRLSLVDLEDVAAIAAKVLLENNHGGATYQLCGPGLYSQTEIAGILSAELGRVVHGQVIPRDVWAAGARDAGLGDYARETLLKMFDYYEQYDFWGNDRVLAWLLGRAPTSLRQFLRKIINQGDAP